MATIKENWTMPAYVGQECDDCYEIWIAYAWYDSQGRVSTIATCNCNIADVPWPLNETSGDFRQPLEALGFIWTQNPNEE